MVIVDILEIILEVIFTWLSPEGVAEKVNNQDISNRTKWFHITFFTLIYLATIIGLVFSFIFVPDNLYKLFAIILIIYLVYCIVKFYSRIIK